MSSSLSTFKDKGPRAEKREHVINQLGQKRSDPYAWMKDKNWRDVLKDPSVLREDIREHLVAENEFAEEVLKDTEGLQKTLFQEMKGRMSDVEDSVPWPKPLFIYSRRFAKDAQYAVHIRKKRLAGADPLTCAPEEEILIDENKRAEGKPYYSLSSAHVSNDERLFAFAEDTQGSEIYRISILDLQTKEFLPPVEGTTGSFVLDPKVKFIFWVERDDEGRPREIFRRPIAGGEAVSVYKETNSGFFVNLSLSASKDYILIERGDHETNETLIIPVIDVEAEPRKTASLKKGVRYHLHHWKDRFIVLSNYDERHDFAIFECLPTKFSMRSWREIVPHRPGHFIVDLDLSRNNLVWVERTNGNCELLALSKPQVSQLSRAKAEEKERMLKALQTKLFNAPEDAYALDLAGFLSFDLEWLRFVYQSPSTPSRVYDLEIRLKKLILRKERAVPSGFDKDRFQVHRLFAKGKGGVEIPITLLCRKDRKPAGGPLLLYGYGSYGISMDPYFNSNCLSLVERGWVYAIAHIRGGSEKGWNWFEQGRKEHKKNTFKDFISAAEYLCETHWTEKGRIVAMGGSAGGLLMGAVSNMAPELFSGIIAQVPFVDTLNTMSDTDLPLTPPEWPEWGNPLKDEKAYKLIKSYSPYDNVKAKQYPPIFALGGLSDPRVTYWEPAKWIAKLREKASGGPFLCKINMEAGHGGNSGRFGRLKEVALVYAFALAAEENHKKVDSETA